MSVRDHEDSVSASGLTPGTNGQSLNSFQNQDTIGGGGSSSSFSGPGFGTANTLNPGPVVTVPIELASAGGNSGPSLPIFNKDSENKKSVEENDEFLQSLSDSPLFGSIDSDFDMFPQASRQPKRQKVSESEVSL